MKYTALLLAAILICSIALTGCDRDSSSEHKNTSDITLSLAEEEDIKEPPKEEEPQEEKSDEKKDNSEKAPKTEQPKYESKPAEAPAKTETPKPVDENTYTENLTDDKPDTNPNKLDTDLYSTFKENMDKNFERKKGTLSVYRLNADGTEGAYELKFDLTNAYDEEGRLNKRKSIEAEMKIAETLQSSYNYGQGSREDYSTYDEYIEQVNWLKTPLLCEGFKPENFSKITETHEDGSTLIEATFAPKAVNKLYDMEIDGVVTAYIQLDEDGNVEALGWEQTDIIDDYPTVVAESEYTFS